MRTCRCALLVALFAISAIGCDLGSSTRAPKATAKAEKKDASPKNVAATKKTKTAAKPSEMSKDDAAAERRRKEWEANSKNRAIRGEFSSFGASPVFGGAVGGSYPALSPDEAIEKVTKQALDSLSERSVLLVWLVDQSTSGKQILDAVAPRIKRFYTEAPAARPLSSAVVSFAGDVKFPLAEPSEDRAKVAAALTLADTDSSGSELLFAAVRQAAEKYAPLRNQSKDVMFVVVTDESGDDEDQLEEAIKLLKKRLIPVFVVGLPAPLGLGVVAGKYAEGDAAVSSAIGTKVKVGPESRLAENIQFNAGNSAFSLADSGFGPWALERLSRQTGGQFLAVRSLGKYGNNGGWPSAGAPRFDPEVMRKYEPEWIGDAEYTALLAENKARLALVNAAKLAPVTISLNGANRTFGKGQNEADLKRRLDDAQRIAARLDPLIDSFYSALKPGEADRAKLTSPRWQAEFDSAYGRVLAAKARVDGYNAMLALLKTGKNFQKPTSTVWELEPAEKSEAGSQIAKMGDSAVIYLTRVKTEHPGTPWAALAEAELRTPMGWKWSER